MPSSSALTVLLLEDQPLIALEIEDLLLSAGIDRVTCLRGCQEALAWLGSEQPSLIILDYQLTDGDGLPVLDFAAAHDIPCMIHSAMPAIAQASAERLGKTVWVDKPADPDLLIETAMALLQGQSRDI